jgi:hypothetical protein
MPLNIDVAMLWLVVVVVVVEGSRHMPLKVRNKQ